MDRLAGGRVRIVGHQAEVPFGQYVTDVVEQGQAPGSRQMAGVVAPGIPAYRDISSSLNVRTIPWNLAG